MASSSMSEHFNPLQQRAAAAAQALLAPGRAISQREIQAMLEKNEAALRGWSTLHRQQPAKTNSTEHKEWTRRCVTIRQQIGARLELLASLADKQIAQEDEENDGQRMCTSSAKPARQIDTLQHSKLTAPSAVNPDIQQQATPVPLDQMFTSPQVSTMTMPMDSVSPLVSMTMPSMDALTPPTLFPEPPMPTIGFASTSSSIFFPTEQTNSMETSSGFALNASITASGVMAPTHEYSMSSGNQTFTPNAYMTSTSRQLSSSTGYMNQQDYMMGGGMMNPQQQHFMSMPTNLVLSGGGGNVYGNSTYGMSSAAASANLDNSRNGNINTSSSNFPVDPFMTPLGFNPGATFGSSDFPMTGMTGMPVHHEQYQMMGSMNGATFEAPMMPNNYAFGPSIGMPAPLAQNMMPQPVLTQQFQSTPQAFQQPIQLHQFPAQHLGVGPISLSPDSALFGDNNVNIFEGLTDDAFFSMQ